MPGLVATVCYISSNNVVDTGSGCEGRAREGDVDAGYRVQSGSLRNVATRIRHVVARANYRSAIDEDRLMQSDTLSGY